MATFLVERYWPGVTPAAARDVNTALGRVGARIVDAFVAETDEVCFWYVDAGSRAEVAAAFASADVTFDRISVATSLRGSTP